MNEKPQKEHLWLQRLVGQWKFETEFDMGPDCSRMIGSETVRSLGGLWTIGEGSGTSPEGSEFNSIMTLGFDPKKGKFVGTFIASMMTHLWPYEGELNSDGNILTLHSLGPSFTGEPTNAEYVDIIEFIDENHRTLVSKTINADGVWNQFMFAHYHRI